VNDAGDRNNGHVLSRSQARPPAADGRMMTSHNHIDCRHFTRSSVRSATPAKGTPTIGSLPHHQHTRRIRRTQAYCSPSDDTLGLECSETLSTGVEKCCSFIVRQNRSSSIRQRHRTGDLRALGAKFIPSSGLRRSCSTTTRQARS
jgi:hypothetical protein